MAYLHDFQRVEMALPAHMMLAVLLAGANCADPGLPKKKWSLDEYGEWQRAWKRHNERVENDPEFAKSYEEFKRTKELLIEACDEPIRDLWPEKKRMSVLRRIEGLHARAVEPYLNVPIEEGEVDHRVKKIGLIAYYLINRLVETSYLIIPETTAFGQALGVMLPALSPWSGATPTELAGYDALLAEAREQYSRVLKRLQLEGYYLGIEERAA